MSVNFETSPLSEADTKEIVFVSLFAALIGMSVLVFNFFVAPFIAALGIAFGWIVISSALNSLWLHTGSDLWYAADTLVYFVFAVFIGLNSVTLGLLWAGLFISDIGEKAICSANNVRFIDYRRWIHSLNNS